MMKGLRAIFFILFFLSLSQPIWPRWVSMVPAITETIHELGVGERLVGVSSFCQYSTEACKKIAVGTPFTPDYEKILKLKPELVLTQEMKDSQFENKIKKMGLAYKSIKLEDLNDVFKLIDEISLLSKVKGTHLKKKIEKQRTKLKSLEKTGRFLAIISRKKIDDKVVSLTAAGKKTYLAEVIELTGYTNWFEKVEGYKEVNLEAILQSPPDIVFYFGKEELGNLLSPMVKLKIKKIDPTHALIPGPRVHLYMEELYEALIP